jgi:hypothetical protein
MVYQCFKIILISFFFKKKKQKAIIHPVYTTQNKSRHENISVIFTQIEIWDEVDTKSEKNRASPFFSRTLFSHNTFFSRNLHTNNKWRVLQANIWGYLRSKYIMGKNHTC